MFSGLPAFQTLHSRVKRLHSDIQLRSFLASMNRCASCSFWFWLAWLMRPMQASGPRHLMATSWPPTAWWPRGAKLRTQSCWSCLWPFFFVIVVSLVARFGTLGLILDHLRGTVRCPLARIGLQSPPPRAQEKTQKTHHLKKHILRSSGSENEIRNSF